MEGYTFVCDSHASNFKKINIYSRDLPIGYEGNHKAIYCATLYYEGNMPYGCGVKQNRETSCNALTLVDYIIRRPPRLSCRPSANTYGIL